jgi:NAD(P)-dependent dehydrogenase (short-subunit alcohol dehydrogenase family)
MAQPTCHRLDGKVAIVTGGASGIGRALAEGLGRRGARVMVTDLDLAGAKAVADGIVAAGGQADAATVDVTRDTDVRQIVDLVAARHERIDLMVNNAGIAVGGEVRDLTVADWRRIIDVNLLGVVHGVAAAYPRMVAQAHGQILNIASLAGLGGWPTMAPYAMTKFAVVGLSLSLRAEAASLGVRVSVACPGFVRSGIYEAARIANADAKALFAKVPLTPMPTERAAARILRGAERNEAVIVFPFYARLLWWLGRINSALLTPLHRRMLADFRSVRRG